MTDKSQSEESSETDDETTQSSQKEEGVEMEGIVREALRGKFKVEIPNPDPAKKPHIVLAHLSGRMRKNFIKIVPGDSVKVEVSPYDFSRGRITFRNKG